VVEDARSKVSREAADRWSAEDELILDALAAGLSYPEAGARARVTDRTVQRRMKDIAFAAEVSRRRWERVRRLTGSLTNLGDDAVEAIRDSLLSPASAQRLRAAHLALTLAIRFSQVLDLDERVRQIERRLADNDSGQSGSEPSNG
jgi:hypothetical protein